MQLYHSRHWLSLIFLYMMATTVAGQPGNRSLIEQVTTEFGKQKGVFALAFRNIQTGETILLNEYEQFHAASTMKTPVMIELYKQAAAGRFSLQDSVLVKNEFKSIVDSSLYSLRAGDDSDSELYTRTGTRQTVYDLMYRMIIKSSNLATNMLIEMADGRQVTQTMRELGARDIQVLRGVEDSKAYAKGLNNTTTAYDQMLIYEKMAKGKIVDQSSSDAMIKVLLDQKHNEVIPARLPAGVSVAHKTGWITGVRHDCGIVFLPDGRKYVLVLLSKKLEDDKSAIEVMSKVSEIVYRYVTGS